MCSPYLMAAVKARMMSRRDLFKVGGGAALAAATVAAAPARAQAGFSQVIDLTHVFTPDFPTYDGDAGIAAETVFNLAEHGFNLDLIRVNEHAGTHIDAPLHFSDGASIDEVPVGDLVVPLAVIDIREKAAASADAELTPDDLAAWIAAHGPIPDRACVAVLSGWEDHLGSDRFRGLRDDGLMHFPGVHLEATQMLLEETTALGLGIDTLSIDYGPSQSFDTHYAWLPAGKWALENMANLALLPPVGATLVVGAPKHKGGTGGPARLIALV